MFDERYTAAWSDTLSDGATVAGLLIGSNCAPVGRLVSQKSRQPID